MMKNKFFFLILCSFQFFHFYAHGQNFDWINSTGYIGEGKSITIDENLSLYATGHFIQNASFGDITLTSTGNNPEIYLAKYDTSGNCLWAKGIYGSLYKSCFEVGTDQNGDIYITGMYDGTVLFDDISLTTSGYFDIFLAKYNPDGECLWAISAGGTHFFDHTMTLDFDSENNVYITGSFEHTAIFGDTTVSSGVNSGGDPNVEWGGDAFVAKYSSDGEFAWVKYLPGSHHINRGHSLAVDSEDDIYVTGKFEGEMYFENDTISSLGSFDIFTLKLDSDGNVIWVNSSGGFSDDKPTPSAAAIDENDNVYFTGYFRENAFFNGQQLTSNGDIDIYIAKYNTDGELLWITSEGGTQAERIYGLTQHGNLIYATGYMFGNSVFNEDVILNSYGGRDIFISCYNTDGEFYWAENHGGPGDDWAFEISHDQNTGIYITGFHNDNAVFGDTALSANQYKNLFIGKFTDENSCVFVDEMVGTKSSGFIIFPNPANNQITIQLRLNKPAEVNVSIKDQQGRLLQTEKFNSHLGQNFLKLDVSDLALGIYLLELTSNENILHTQKMIKR